MKAMAKCHKCGKTIETKDITEIEQNESFHKCREGLRIVRVKWNLLQESNSKNEDSLYEQ